MQKYAEVKEKQKNVDAVREKDEPFGRGVWVGFTYKPRGKVSEEEVRFSLPFTVLFCLLPFSRG